MTKQTRSKKDGKGREEEWSWEETPEVTECLQRLWRQTERKSDRGGQK